MRRAEPDWFVAVGATSFVMSFSHTKELTFGILGSTQMACPEQESDLEFDFFRALEAT